MRLRSKSRRRSRLLIEPPASATGDIAFNLIVFFLVCASVQPDTGRKQSLPRSETVEEQQTENIEVAMTRTTVLLNGDPIRIDEFPVQLKRVLDTKTTAEGKVVVVKSQPDTPYSQWINITSLIADLGGIVTLQVEEEREVQIE